MAHSTEKTEEVEGRKSVPAQWIDTIRFTLADIVARGEWDDFGLFRILNRISFACRFHLMFVVVFRTSVIMNGSEVRTEYKASPVISSLDPVFFDLIFSYMKKYKIIKENYSFVKFEKDQKKEPISLNEKEAKKYVINIWNTGICIIAFQLKVPKEKLGYPPNMELIPVAIDSQLGSFIAETLKPFDGTRSASKEYPDLLWSDRMYMPQDAAYRGLGKLRETNVLKRAKKDTPKILYDQEKIIINESIGEIKNLIDDEYKKRLDESPLLNQNLSDNFNDDFSPITNATFYIKTFDAETVRYRHYRYNVRAVLPRDRLDDIKKGFDQARRSDFIPFDDGSLDNEFWSHTNSSKGLNDIGQYLQQPMPPSVRLFVENVLMSGTTLIKPGVFTRAAIGWVEDGVTRTARYEALFQLCCHHYMLQLGSPVRPVDAKELSIVALPFRCSGGIWMCGVYLRDNPPGPIPDLVDQKRFEESALIYHSLFRESERRLRRRVRGRYTNAIGALVAQETVRTAQRSKGKHLLCIDATSRDNFLKRMEILTRVYPFDGIKILPDESDDDSPIDFATIEFKTTENGFFDRLTLHDFINEESNVRRLMERILLASVLNDEAISND
ncbi:MAG: hypothetical protein KDC43_27425 [Saprospiraceae bacterium]|nr:hypothetical protein [Saprospiraceae bacterium]